MSDLRPSEGSEESWDLVKRVAADRCVYTGDCTCTHCYRIRQHVLREAILALEWAQANSGDPDEAIERMFEWLEGQAG